MNLVVLAVVTMTSVACWQADISSEPLYAHELRVGDCMNAPPEGDVGYVFIVPCDQGHDAEVFAIVETGKEDEEFPGEEEVIRRVDLDCEDEWYRYLGVATDDPDIGYYIIYPYDEAWELGLRTAQCLVTDLTGTNLKGSLRADAASD